MHARLTFTWWQYKQVLAASKVANSLVAMLAGFASVTACYLPILDIFCA